MEESNENVTEISVSTMSADELIETLCETAIALYCYDLIIKNGVQSDITEQTALDLTSAFNGTRYELSRRASRGTRKKKTTVA
jgi:hypothetical protein